MGTVDGTSWSAITADGSDVQEVTVDGNVAWRAFSPFATFSTDEYNNNWSGRAKDENQGEYTYPSTNRALHGNESLYNEAGSDYDWLESLPGDDLSTYLTVPVRFSVYYYTGNANGMDWDIYFNGVSGDSTYMRLRFWGSNERCYFYQSYNGNLENSGRDPSYNPPSNTWVECEITVEGRSGNNKYGLDPRDAMFRHFEVDSNRVRQNPGSPFSQAKFSDQSWNEDIVHDPQYDKSEGGYEVVFANGSSALNLDAFYVH